MPTFESNNWLPIDGFQKSYGAYFDAMCQLMHSLLRIIAQGLTLPECFFNDKIEEHISMHCVLSYPLQCDVSLVGQLTMATTAMHHRFV
jgi:isopenicillin N synthase-like dioxygenase